MKKIIQHIIIHCLLVVTACLGMAQAGVDLCPPDCSHCGAVPVKVSSCCGDMGAGAVAVPVPEGTNSHASDCSHGSYCMAMNDKHETIAAYQTYVSDFDFVLPVNSVLTSVSIFAVPHYHESLKYPSPGNPPALYTINCSLLI